MLRNILLIHTDPRGKWMLNYEGIYVVRKVFSGGALILATMDGEDLPSLVNEDAVKKVLRLKKNKREHDKLKTQKGVLCKNGYPDRLKTRKTSLGKIRDS